MKKGKFRPRRKAAGWPLFIALLIGLAGAIPAQERSAADDFNIPEFRLKKVEKMVEVNGRMLHCIAYGKGKPVIVLLSGLNAPQDFWNALIRPVAEKTTVVTYDRSGCGRSQLGDLPPHGQQAAADLKVLLEKIAAPGPYILVGHSYGANVARLFAAAHPALVGGLILLDGQYPGILEEQKKALAGEDLAKLERMISSLKSKANPKSESDYLLATLEQAMQAGPLPQVPFVVVTSGASRLSGIPLVFSEDGRQQLLRLSMELQKKTAAEIPGGEHIVLEEIGPTLHNEDPKPVVKIVKAMLSRVRKGQKW